jgi:hypothetical protein
MLILAAVCSSRLPAQTEASQAPASINHFQADLLKGFLNVW